MSQEGWRADNPALGQHDEATRGGPQRQLRAVPPTDGAGATRDVHIDAVLVLEPLRALPGTGAVGVQLLEAPPCGEMRLDLRVDDRGGGLRVALNASAPLLAQALLQQFELALC